MLQAPSFSSASSDRVTVTLIPGDGVGPEMMDSCQEVLQSMGARLDFEPIYFSEVRKFERRRMTFCILHFFRSITERANPLTR